jgi:tRNA threonylcarbamoyladenosine biosynthesis protein TsaE
MGHSVVTCYSIEETYALAKQVMSQLKGGELIGLTGELGAGKTEFVRGLAKVIGIMDDVSSPSFILQNIYQAPNLPEAQDCKEHSTLLAPITTIYHWDLYRVAENVDLNEILEGKKNSNSITLIEWFEKAPALAEFFDLTIEVKIIENKMATATTQQPIFTDTCIRQWTIK